MQTKLYSFLESLTNITVGFFVGIASQLLVFPLFDMYISFADNILICTWWTARGIVRGYVIRRWFTKRTEKI